MHFERLTSFEREAAPEAFEKSVDHEPSIEAHDVYGSHVSV